MKLTNNGSAQVSVWVQMKDEAAAELINQNVNIAAGATEVFTFDYTGTAQMIFFFVDSTHEAAAGPNAGDITISEIKLGKVATAEETTPEEEIPTPAEPTTASKTVADLITEYGWTNTTTKQEFNLDDNVSVKINGGSNTGKAYDGDHIRVYATDTPAGTITISVAEGYELVSIKISAQTGTYAFLCVDGSTTDICNETVEVSGSSVLLNSVKNGSNGKQIRVTALEVVYKPVA